MLTLFLHLLFLFRLCQYTGSEALEILDGKRASIPCDLKNPSTVLWFRTGKTGMDVVGFVDSKGDVKDDHKVTGCKIKDKERLYIEEFNKERDSGVYGCSTITGKKIAFGKSTVLAGPPDPTTTTTRRITTAPPPSTTTTPCPCKTFQRPDSPSSCEVAILAPLVAGCILLFLILILTIRHCSRVRTRGCPHHHKKRPKNPTQMNLGKPGRYT